MVFYGAKVDEPNVSVDDVKIFIYGESVVCNRTAGEYVEDIFFEDILNVVAVIVIETKGVVYRVGVAGKDFFTGSGKGVYE